MFDMKIKRPGGLTIEDVKHLVEGMGEILAEEFQQRDAEIRKLQGQIQTLQRDIETERRLRLGMKSR